MKKIFWISAAALALALGACSNDEVLPAAGDGAQWSADGKGYVSLMVNLPQTKATMNRAEATFDDGTPAEYAVNNGYLLIFGGESEATATLSGGYELDLPTASLEGTTTDQITSTIEVTQAIDQVSGGEVYALVVLNANPAVLSVDATDATVSVAGEAFAGTFTDLLAKTMTAANGDVSAITTGATGFLMLNAPLASAVGGANWAGEVTTLAKVTPYIYNTEAQAASNPSASIFVERAVAKVQLSANNATGNMTLGQNQVAWNINGWVLNNTNTTSYIVRNSSTDAGWWGLTSEDVEDYRFVGTSEVKAGAGYRTYWAEDPNYNTVEGLYSPWYAANPAAGDLLAVDAVTYCLENTFDVDHQNQNLTTTAVVAATIGDGSDFFTINGSRTTLYAETELVDAVKAAIIGNSAFATAVEAALQAAGGGEFTADDIAAVTLSAGAGEVTVEGFTYADGVAAKLGGEIPAALQEDGAAYAAALTAANGMNIVRYAGGVSYYPVLIKHFGDTQTPWQAEDGQSVSYPAPNADANWLGRYGVLRNNWYQLNVTGINNVGYATVPEITASDDTIEKYISVEINVLSWAVRTQNVEL